MGFLLDFRVELVDDCLLFLCIRLTHEEIVLKLFDLRLFVFVIIVLDVLIWEYFDVG